MVQKINLIIVGEIELEDVFDKLDYVVKMFYNILKKDILDITEDDIINNLIITDEDNLEFIIELYDKLGVDYANLLVYTKTGLISKVESFK